MALASWRAFQGQQRSLRRMCQVFSWALARSPGDRSWACAVGGLLRGGLVSPPVGSVHVLTCADVALVGQHDQAAGGQFASDAPDPGSSQVVGGAGQRAGDPQDLAVRGRDDLQVHPVAAVLAGVERPVGGDAVGGSRCRRSRRRRARPSSPASAPGAASASGRPAGSQSRRHSARRSRCRRRSRRPARRMSRLCAGRPARAGPAGQG